MRSVCEEAWSCQLDPGHGLGGVRDVGGWRDGRRGSRARSAAAGALSLTRLWRPLARGVLPVRAAHLAALSGAVRGRGERKTHFSSTVRGSHVSLSADRCASRMGRALSSAPVARTATLSAQRDVGRGPRFVTESRRGSRLSLFSIHAACAWDNSLLKTSHITRPHWDTG